MGTGIGIDWVVPYAGTTLRRMAMIFGVSAIVGGIIGWIGFEQDSLDTADELVGPT